MRIREASKDQSPNGTRLAGFRQGPETRGAVENTLPARPCQVTLGHNRAMQPRILDGAAVAKALRAEAAAGAARLASRGIVPGLTVVLVGEDPASSTYVRNKEIAAKEAGFAGRTLRFPATLARGRAPRDDRRPEPRRRRRRHPRPAPAPEARSRPPASSRRSTRGRTSTAFTRRTPDASCRASPPRPVHAGRHPRAPEARERAPPRDARRRRRPERHRRQADGAPPPPERRDGHDRALEDAGPPGPLPRGGPPRRGHRAAGLRDRGLREGGRRRRGRRDQPRDDARGPRALLPRATRSARPRSRRTARRSSATATPRRRSPGPPATRPSRAASAP